MPKHKQARAELLSRETGEVVAAFPVEVSISDDAQPRVTVRATFLGVRADLDGKPFKMRLAGITDDVTTRIQVDPSGPTTECRIWLEGAAWLSSDWLAKL